MSFCRAEIPKTVVLINGRGGSGKDTVCDIAGKHYKTYTYSTITDVKDAAWHIGWRGGKESKDRAFLSDLKDLCTKYYDHPFNKAVEMYECFVYSAYDVLFLHVREPEEIEKLRQYIKLDGRATVYTLLIQSDRTAGPLGNHADDDVENYDYDFTFQNNYPLDQLDKEFTEFFRFMVFGMEQGRNGGQ